MRHDRFLETRRWTDADPVNVHQLPATSYQLAVKVVMIETFVWQGTSTAEHRAGSRLAVQSSPDQTGDRGPGTGAQQGEEVPAAAGCSPRAPATPRHAARSRKHVPASES